MIFVVVRFSEEIVTSNVAPVSVLLKGQLFTMVIWPLASMPAIWIASCISTLTFRNLSVSLQPHLPALDRGFIFPDSIVSLDLTWLYQCRLGLRIL